MKKHVITSITIFLGLLSVFGSKFNGNVAADGGSGIAISYDVSHYFNKDKNNTTTLQNNFNFNNSPNILIVFEATVNYTAAYHVNAAADTNPKDSSIEYYDKDKHANDVDVFMAHYDASIFFSCHANGGFSSYHNLQIIDNDNNVGNRITVLKLSGSVDHMDFSYEKPVAKQKDGSPYSLNDQDAKEWSNLCISAGKLGAETDSNNKQVFLKMADTFFNYDSTQKKITGSDDTREYPYNVNFHIFT